jgi:hypothetical protein
MAQIPLEYTLCQLQSGNISLAIKTHRRQGGDPVLDVDASGALVRFHLINLFDGRPETIMGARRKDHVDFYFLHQDLCRDRHMFPQAQAQPDPQLKLPIVDPSGTQRPGGAQIRMISPISRYGVERVLIYSSRDPQFTAELLDPELFVDFETTPARGHGYTQQLGEIHYGVGGDADIIDDHAVGPDGCTIEMTQETYATISDEIMGF